MPSRCYLCYTDGESIDHILAGCLFSCRIWVEMMSKLDLQWNRPHSLKAWLEFVNSNAGSSKRDVVWRVGVLAIMWATWMERNN
ncbi:hypothetical protein Syun_021102 [Stephania yunnanensis]|uniref:Reverse transcriptase zinc-binding domain-containing protein n=1 Tax=Stephania yunnanensis TaxID=152371 RepID=A0AAP0IFG2_9MAGN